jgi:N6-L-threonylcarbamoyladenine synthase
VTVVLGIETSCDETAAAVVVDGREIRASRVASQIALHAPYGGIFPEVASRAHIEQIYPIIQGTMDEAGLDTSGLDAIAVTRGPGLAGSLLVGVNAAKGLALGTGLPLVGVNHLEAHLYSVWLPEGEPVQFPIAALIVSGGHTELVLMTGHGAYQRLGGTLDDAAGEAFDKVGRLLGLPYPGGPAIQKAAEAGDPKAFDFPRAWLGEGYDFSFSGLKTAVLRVVKQLQPDTPAGEDVSPDLPIADLAASFQEAVADVLITKTLQAAESFNAREVFIVGGVSANKALREGMKARASCPVRVPPLSLCTDNAAMIAAVGYFRYRAGQRDGLDMDVLPTWPLV